MTLARWAYPLTLSITGTNYTTHMAQVSAQAPIANIVPRLSLLCLPCHCSLVAYHPGWFPPCRFSRVPQSHPSYFFPRGWLLSRVSGARNAPSVVYMLNQLILLLIFFFLKVRRQVCGRGVIEKVNSFLTSRCLNCPMRQLLFKLFTSLIRHQGPSPT